MRSTIMEYGLTIIATVLIMVLFNMFLDMFLDGGSMKETISDYINTIC